MSRRLGAFFFFLFLAQANAAQQTVMLDGPGESESALFVQEVLGRAYQQLGYKIDYLTLPLARSFVEANAGRIDGLRARVGTVADRYPNLLAVPFPLLDFKVILLADRRKCGMCDIGQMNSIATIRGFKALEDYVASEQFKNLKLELKEYTTLEQAFVLLDAQKVDGVIVPDTIESVKLSAKNPYLIKQTLAVLPDFHYVNHMHKDLAKRLLVVLEKMEDTGEIQLLRDKYGLTNPSQDPMTTELGKVSAISGSWTGFTDSKDGVYWRLLKDIYEGNDTFFHHQVGNWKRAKAKFASGDLDMLVGAYAHEADETMLLSDLHIDYETSVYALGIDQDKLSKLLSGQIAGSACYLVGYDFNQFLPATISIHETDNGADCERLLRAGRVDMLVGYDLDMSAQLRLDYASALILEAQPLFVVYHNNNRGHLLHDIFESKFRQILKDGRLGDYYKKPADQISAHLITQQNLRK